MHVSVAAALTVGVAVVLAVRPGRFVRADDDGALRAAGRVVRGDLWNDSWWPMHEAVRLLDDGTSHGSVYRELLATEDLKFQYPPPSLLLSKVFWRFGIEAEPIYEAMSYVALLATAVAIWGIARWSLQRYLRTRLRPGVSVALAAAAGSATLFYQPVVWSVSLGQIQAWINAAFAVALYCMLTGRERSAGVLMGLAACVKPQYALFLLWGMLRGRRRYTVSMFATGVVGFVAGGLGFGFRMYFQYVDWLRYIGQRGEVSYLNHSLNGLLNRLVALGRPGGGSNLDWMPSSFAPYSPWVYYPTLVSSIVIIAICLFQRRGALRSDLGSDFCLAALGFALAAPIAWDHHYGVLLPAFAYLWPTLWFDRTYATRRGLRVTVLVALVLTTDRLWFTDAVASTPLNVFQSSFFFAAVAIFVVLVITRAGGQGPGVPSSVPSVGYPSPDTSESYART